MMEQPSAGTIISRATDSQRRNYNRLQVDEEDLRLLAAQNHTLLNSTTDNFSKVFLAFPILQALMQPEFAGCSKSLFAG